MTMAVVDGGLLTRASTNPGAVGSRSFLAGVDFSPGDMAVVLIAADNAGLNGAMSLASVTDEPGNTYNLIIHDTKDPGGANAGVTGAIARAIIGPAGLLATENITINFTPNTVRCAAVVYKVVPTSSNHDIEVYWGDVATGYGDGYGGVTGFESDSRWLISNVASGKLIICGLAAQRRTSATGVSTDATNGVWVVADNANEVFARDSDNSSENGSIMMSCQYKLTTGAGDQLWRMNHSATTYWVGVNVLIQETAATIPQQPNPPTVTPNVPGGVNVSWTAPDDNGRPITNYAVEYSDDDFATWDTAYTGSANTNLNITGLGNGVVWKFRVMAYNSVGWGYISNPTTQTTWNFPGVVLTPTVTPNAVGGFNVSWSAPSNGGAAIDYYHLYYDSGGGWVQYNGNIAALNVNATGFGNGSTVNFKVYAHNAVGFSGEGGQQSGLSWDRPDQVTDLTAEHLGSGNVSLVWTPPDNNGTIITDYLIEYSIKDANSWNVFSHSPIGNVSDTTVTGLNSGVSYDFRIKAINAVGSSASYSNIATAVSPLREIWGYDLSQSTMP